MFTSTRANQSQRTKIVLGQGALGVSTSNDRYSHIRRIAAHLQASFRDIERRQKRLSCQQDDRGERRNEPQCGLVMDREVLTLCISQLAFGNLSANALHYI